MLKYDQIQPLTDIFEEYASDRLKQYVRSGGEALMEAISLDGEMYAIPAPNLTASGVNTMWIRQDWLMKYLMWRRSLWMPKWGETIQSVS